LFHTHRVALLSCPRLQAVYIGRRNDSEVPMQANAELFVPYEPTPDQANWVSRFHHATIVSKIVYLTAITRPDIAYPVSMLSRFMAQPTSRVFFTTSLPESHGPLRSGIQWRYAGHARIFRQRLGHVSGHPSLHLRHCRVHVWWSSVLDVTSTADRRHLFHHRCLLCSTGRRLVPCSAPRPQSPGPHNPDQSFHR
jgi:hypothetical protein